MLEICSQFKRFVSEQCVFLMCHGKLFPWGRCYGQKDWPLLQKTGFKCKSAISAAFWFLGVKRGYSFFLKWYKVMDSSKPERTFNVIKFCPLILQIPCHVIPFINLVSFMFKAVRKIVKYTSDLMVWIFLISSLHLLTTRHCLFGFVLFCLLFC